MILNPRSINQCARCGACRSVCPIFEELGWESSTARGRILVMKSLSQGAKASSDVLDSLNTCTTCGICSESCPAGIRPPELIEGARRELVSLGLMTAEQSMLNQHVIASNNIFGEGSSRNNWLANSEISKEKADFIYFAGCLASYRFPEMAAKTFEVLRKFGATMLPEERCCGSPLLRTGFNANQLMQFNKNQISYLGAHTLITECAGCYTAFKNDYSPNFRVMSVPEFLAEHISQLDLNALDLTVTYHDPCHLGRRHGIYDPPRRVIEAICDLKEMKAARNQSRCCGGGGGVRAGYKELSLRLAKRRLEDIPEEVDYIITSCPMCIRNLNDAGGNGRVIDLVDLVYKALH